MLQRETEMVIATISSQCKARDLEILKKILNSIVKIVFFFKLSCKLFRREKNVAARREKKIKGKKLLLDFAGIVPPCIASYEHQLEHQLYVFFFCSWETFCNILRLVKLAYLLCKKKKGLCIQLINVFTVVFISISSALRLQYYF